MRPVPGRVVVAAGVDAETRPHRVAQQPKPAEGFAADSLGLVEPADLGHREHPGEAVVEVEFEGVVAPPFQPVEQVRGLLELAEFAVRGGADEHPAQGVVRGFGELQRQRRVRGGEQVGGGQGRTRPARGEALQGAVDLLLVVERRIEALVECVQLVEPVNQLQAEVIVAGRHYHGAQQGGPGVGGQSAVGQAATRPPIGEFAERLRRPQQKAGVAGEAVDVAGQRGSRRVGVGAEQCLDLGLRRGCGRGSWTALLGRLVELREVVGAQGFGQRRVGIGGLEQ